MFRVVVLHKQAVCKRHWPAGHILQFSLPSFTRTKLLTLTKPFFGDLREISSCSVGERSEKSLWILRTGSESLSRLNSASLALTTPFMVLWISEQSLIPTYLRHEPHRVPTLVSSFMILKRLPFTNRVASHGFHLLQCSLPYLELETLDVIAKKLLVQ